MNNPETIQPNTPPVEAKKSWLSKHMFLGIVFLFAIIAAAISGIYYWQTISQIPSSVQFPIHKDVTADWKTYTSDQYGFEFKYPNDWKNEEFIFYSPKAPIDVYGNVADHINLNIDSDNSNLPLKEWVQKNLKDMIIKYNGPITIGGGEAEQYTTAGMTEYITTYFSKTPIIAELTVVFNSDYQKEYNQILSTFKFTK